MWLLEVQFGVSASAPHGIAYHFKVKFRKQSTTFQPPIPRLGLKSINIWNMVVMVSKFASFGRKVYPNNSTRQLLFGNIFVHHFNPMYTLITFLNTWHVSISITIVNSMLCIYRTMIMLMDTCQVLRIVLIVHLELK